MTRQGAVELLHVSRGHWRVYVSRERSHWWVKELAAVAKRAATQGHWEGRTQSAGEPAMVRGPSGRIVVHCDDGDVDVEHIATFSPGIMLALLAQLRQLRALLPSLKIIIDGFRRPQEIPPDQWHDAYVAVAEVMEKLGVQVNPMRTPAQEQIRAIVLELATLEEWDYEPAQVRDIVARARAAVTHPKRHP